MTNLLLENKDESKVEELMEELMKDYKKDLKNKERDEKDILEYLTQMNNFLEYYEIPYHSKKYGVNTNDKKYLNCLLELVETIQKLTTNNKQVENREWEKIHILTIKCCEDLDHIGKDYNSISNNEDIDRRERNKKLTFLKDTRVLIKELIIEREFKGFDENQFTFHKDSFYKLNTSQQELQSDFDNIKEEYNCSKHQCLKIIKKINYSLDKIGKQLVDIETFLPLKDILDTSPFIKITQKVIKCIDESTIEKFKDINLNSLKGMGFCKLSISLNIMKGEMI